MALTLMGTQHRIVIVRVHENGSTRILTAMEEMARTRLRGADYAENTSLCSQAGWHCAMLRAQFRVPRKASWTGATDSFRRAYNCPPSGSQMPHPMFFLSIVNWLHHRCTGRAARYEPVAQIPSELATSAVSELAEAHQPSPSIS